MCYRWPKYWYGVYYEVAKVAHGYMQIRMKELGSHHLGIGTRHFPGQGLVLKIETLVIPVPATD